MGLSEWDSRLFAGKVGEGETEEEEESDEGMASRYLSIPTLQGERAVKVGEEEEGERKAMTQEEEEEAREIEERRLIAQEDEEERMLLARREVGRVVTHEEMELELATPPEGEVAWGEDQWLDCMNVTHPLLLSSLPPIQQVACGDYHTLFLTRDSRVLACGANCCGQLGLGSQASSAEREPQIVAALAGKEIVSIACGSEHSVAVERGGVVWVWGRNIHGQLGNMAHQLHYRPPDFPKEATPVKMVFDPLPPPVEVRQVACGRDHTVVLFEDGQVWGCGHNFRFQLGIEHGQNAYYATCMSSVWAKYTKTQPQLRQVRVRCALEHVHFTDRETHTFVLAQKRDMHACTPMNTHTVRGEAKWARGGGGALAPQLPRAIRVGPNEGGKKIWPPKFWEFIGLNTGGLSDFFRGLSSDPRNFSPKIG